jgi:hypothetical protein
MFAANSHVIRHASEADEQALRRLAEASGQHPVHRPALIGQVAGRPAAAVSLIDLRVVADPAEQTARLTQMLLLRARVIHALHASPSLRARVVAALRTA